MDRTVGRRERGYTPVYYGAVGESFTGSRNKKGRSMIFKILIIWALVMLIVWYATSDDDSVTKTVNGNKKKRYMNELVKDDE